MVTGVIFSQYNSFGVVGIAPKVELYPVKVLDQNGEGDISDIKQGVEWCIDHDIQLINMSFSILNNDSALEEAIEKALRHGIIIVAAASNTFGHEVGYPASYNGVISVTAVDSKGKIGNSSPRGKVDFSAPGVDVISTSLGGTYELSSGTSIAAPYITGLIALVLQSSLQQHTKPQEIIDFLAKHSIDMGKHGKDDVYGFGLPVLTSVLKNGG